MNLLANPKYFKLCPGFRSFAVDEDKFSVAKYKTMLNTMTKMNRASGDFINGIAL
jgi:hypothetical protein